MTPQARFFLQALQYPRLDHRAVSSAGPCTTTAGGRVTGAEEGGGRCWSRRAQRISRISCMQPPTLSRSSSGRVRPWFKMPTMRLPRGLCRPWPRTTASFLLATCCWDKVLPTAVVKAPSKRAKRAPNAAALSGFLLILSARSIKSPTESLVLFAPSSNTANSEETKLKSVGGWKADVNWG
jgi:hypothetical protein